jgi:hypothetical protein
MYHILYWSNSSADLLRELSHSNAISASHMFFWMAMMNNSNDMQLLLDRTIDGMKENHNEYILEFVTMMIKAKRNEEVLEYLIGHDHIE